MSDYDLSNDEIYKCDTCSEIIKCFSSVGSTDFCCCCGSRDINVAEEKDDN